MEGMKLTSAFALVETVFPTSAPAPAAAATATAARPRTSPQARITLALRSRLTCAKRLKLNLCLRSPLLVEQRELLPLSLWRGVRELRPHFLHEVARDLFGR